MERNLQPLILLELNEVNFDFVRRYIARGHLPALASLLARHGCAQTTSESEYEQLEPWIQWVSAHTGLTYAEHEVFRLGDIVESPVEQIWEKLEAAGLSVGAVSPINAANRTRNAAFFLPDPWTRTPVTGAPALQGLHEALAQVVGDNARGVMTARSLRQLLLGWLANLRVSSLGQQICYALQRRQRPWTASLFLDRLLADVFVRCWRATRPAFASLFLNAAAHIQHHYMFSSAVYDGPLANPPWYLRKGADPLLDAYSLYDRIVADVLALPGEPRVMIGTGLHQDPYTEELFYYRLRDHGAFLRRLEVPFASVEARMSRDFTVYCSRPEDARRCEAVLARLRAPDGATLFTIDNRGASLFAMLTYPREIARGFTIRLDSRPMWDLHDDVAFVALKNGEHNGIGYFIDTGARPVTAGTRFPLTDVFARVCEAFGVQHRRHSAEARPAA